LTLSTAEVEILGLLASWLHPTEFWTVSKQPLPRACSRSPLEYVHGSAVNEVDMNIVADVGS
jgi:hypothetical protein